MHFFGGLRSVKDIGQLLLSVKRSNLQLVSGTNQFNIINLQLVRQILPMFLFFV